RRVLGRKRAEAGAGPGADGVHAAPDQAIGKRDDADRRGLPGADPTDLGLLEVGDDPDSLERNDDEKRLADLDHLPWLDGLLRDHARGRREDSRLRELELGGGQLRLRL